MQRHGDDAVRRRERAVRNENPSSERLCYFLRHHPAKDHVFASKGEPGGWFKFTDILPWFRNLTEEQLDHVIASSRSFIPPHAQRFESRTIADVKWARARYGHSFDTNFSDVERALEKDEVPTLTDLLLRKVIAEMPKYLSQLAEIGDGSLVSLLFHKYKRTPGVTMSNRIIKSFLLPLVSVLDFKGILVEDSIIRLLPKQCPSLYFLSMEGCFTCMTDTNLQFLLKRCKELRQLDLSGCKYLTELGMQHITKFGTALTYLALRWIKPAKLQWVKLICTSLPNLEHLNITGCPGIHSVDLDALREEFSQVFIQFDTVDDIPRGDEPEEDEGAPDFPDLVEADPDADLAAPAAPWGGGPPERWGDGNWAEEDMA